MISAFSKEKLNTHESAEKKKKKKGHRGQLQIYPGEVKKGKGLNTLF